VRITVLDFGSLLAYVPRVSSNKMQQAKNVMFATKSDSFLEQPRQEPIAMSQWIAMAVRQQMSTLPFISLFQPDTVLVPVPSTSLMQPGTLWVPDRIATALSKPELEERSSDISLGQSRSEKLPSVTLLRDRRPRNSMRL